jgi:FkbM family methyltransferase
MTVVVGLLIGNETWQLLERSIRSLRHFHPEQDVLIYYSLDECGKDIISTLESLGVATVDVGRPGLIGLLSAGTYSAYNTAEFNIKTSFKWLALLAAMTSRLEHVIFVDADIKIISPLPIASFEAIWEHYDVFVQDEGNGILPKHPCTGFIGFKFCEDNVALLEALHKEHCAAIVSADSQHDQAIFFNYISQRIDLYKKVYFLPQMLFPVGYLGPIYRRFNSSRINLSGQMDPVIYHANWAVGVDAKAMLMDAFQSLSTKANAGADEFFSYNVGTYEIQLPAGHLLPIYQAQHPSYDKFLPRLANILPAGSAVIDVGANCGDTLAAMASCNEDLHYLCIEADPTFFSILQTNIDAIQANSPGIRIDALCELIGGKHLDRAYLEGSGGTKKAVISSDDSQSLQSKSLDSVLLHTLSTKAKISLLKTDTDGWDFDVITSAMQIITKHQPLIFFECQYADPQQLNGYTETIDWLAERGYISWFLFDNYGGFILETNATGIIKSLMAYTEKQNYGLSTRTFHYMDILAATPATLPLATSAVAAHQA